MSSVYNKLQESVSYIRGKVKSPPTLAVVLGSGLGAFADQIKSETVIRFDEIPHFHKPTVVGHGGKLVFGNLNGLPLVVQQGRIHYYEGHSMHEVAHPIRTLGLLGVKTVLLTNAAGGLKSGIKPGDLMVIRDHINLMHDNPLLGPNITELGPRFPDMTEAYSKRFRTTAKSVFENLGLKYIEGVYGGLTGPTYETPSEVEYLKRLGIDAVGMSTVPEVIAARHMGIEVACISCITNLAAGMSGQTLSHEEVTTTSKASEKSFSSVLSNLLPRMA